MDASGIDLSTVFAKSAAVVASPAAAAETIIASVTTGAVRADQSVYLFGWAAFTVGTDGVSVQLRARRATVGGTLVGDSGALTAGIAAAKLDAATLLTIDAPGAVGQQVYKLTMQVASGSAASTVSAVTLVALVV